MNFLNRNTLLVFCSALATLGLLGWNFWQKIDQPEPPLMPHKGEVAVNSQQSFRPEPFPVMDEWSALENAEFLLSSHNIENYRKIRDQWLHREKEPAKWFFLDVNAFLIEGKREEAIAQLDSKALSGKPETERLVLLAALHIQEDPDRADQLLSEAIEKDPNDPDLRLFKASLFDAYHRNEIALNEYINAIKNDNDNPFLREELADFLLRQEKYKDALTILHDGLLPPSLDTLWIKAIFWNKVIRPFDSERWRALTIPTGKFAAFASYLKSLPKGVYWDETAFEQLNEREEILKTFQESFWLKLTSLLKNGEERTALQLIKSNPFQALSWMPELEKSLKTVLAYRQEHSEQNVSSPSVTDISSPQSFLAALAAFSEQPVSELIAKVPTQMKKLLISKEALALPFLAAGWPEVTLELHQIEVFPASFPEWISTAFCKALQDNKGDNVALKWAINQPLNASLSLEIAALAQKTNQKPLAIDALKKASAENTKAGLSATLLLSQLYLEQEDAKTAKETLLSQPELIQKVAGKELLARIALKEGAPKTAYDLYLGIEDDSVEAKSFLACKAFAEKDWARAKTLTEALLEKFPDNPQLKENLRKILNQ